MPDPVFGKPLIMYGGIVTFLLLLATATVALVTVKGIYALPVKYHVWLARFTIAFALFHAALGALAYL